MRLLIEQLENSLNSGNYYLSLFTALTLPDIAGALDSADGFATGVKYKAWYAIWGRPRIMDTVLASVPEHARPYITKIENPLDGEPYRRLFFGYLSFGEAKESISPAAKALKQKM